MLRQVTVKNGKLEGLPGNDPRVTVFKGIPFAKAPVGDLRWKRPFPADPWEGVLKAYKFGPISVQDQPGVGTDIYCQEWHVDPDIPMSEDNLYLNVWTPAKRTDEKLPVLLWIFGGAFQWGYTAEMEFNGERLARRGIIVVSVNYRLAALGFLSHPEITAEDPEYPTNFGLLDQKAGLNWVRENIAAFGGDPDNITIAGQSAGGGSVLNQLIDSDNFDAIKGAVILSGMIDMPFDDDILRPHDLECAEKRGVDFFNYLGVKNLAEARAMDAFKIRDLYGQWAAENHPRVAPVIDGIHYKDNPLDLFKKNLRAPVPVLCGYTADEFVMEGVNVVEKTVKETVKTSLENGAGDLYVYEFNTDIPGDDHPGNFHSVDLWFWFNTIFNCHRAYRGHHFELSRIMANHLAEFVKHHDPNGPDDDGSLMPEWKKAEIDDLHIKKFN